MRINGLNMDAENGLTLRDAFDSDAEYEASIEAMADFCPFCCEAPCRCYRGPVEGNLVDVAGEASDAFPVPAFVRATRDLLSLEGEVMARAGEFLAVVESTGGALDVVGAFGPFFAVDGDETESVEAEAVPAETRAALESVLAEVNAYAAWNGGDLAPTPQTTFQPLDGGEALTLDAVTSPYQAGDRVRVTGRGRTETWPRYLSGTVEATDDGVVYVRWDRAAFSDERSLDEVKPWQAD